MFRLNDPILIPHRDFLRSFFLDQPISGPRPPDQVTHGPELVVVMHRAALGNKRSPVPAIAIARTPSRERLKEIPKKLSEGRGGYCHQYTMGHQTGSVAAPASPQL